MNTNHIMVPFRPSGVFFKAFEHAINTAKQNNARITVVKVIEYRAGLGIDMMMTIDMLSRENDLNEFDKILAELQKQAMLHSVVMGAKIIDMHLSPAKAFVDFVSQNDVDLIIMGRIKKNGLEKHFSSDISDDVMALNPPCNVIMVE